MTDSMLPILRAMHDANSDAERAEVLLRCPVNIMMKYRHVLESACERTAFDAGTEYLLCFFAALHEVRHRGEIKGAALRHAQGRLLLICDGAAS
ncbi:hypothetical protein [Brucella intermedia]|uniref:hypothetical protein n=1 Tax=Brucella intermedia TaxID=94625 RepID=UPI00235E8A32|nr:hypothetical protein [Brucella intermedia]